MGLLLRWLLNALALFGITHYGPMWGLLHDTYLDSFGAAVVAVAILAVLNLTVRPILKLLALPITCLTFGLLTVVINALMMLLASRLVEGFTVGSFWDALVASVLYAIVSAVLNAVFNTKKD